MTIFAVSCRIRQITGEAALLADRQSIRLDVPADSIDAASFARLALGTASASLTQAIALYRGELLEGANIRSATFEEWLLAERRRYRQLFEDALERLISLLREERNFDAAADAARLLSESDPMNEAALRALMRHNSEAGRIAHAIKLFDEHAERLRVELGVAPDDDTRHLADALRRRSIVREPTAAFAPDEPACPAAPLTTMPAVAILPFENLSRDPDQQYFSDGSPTTSSPSCHGFDRSSSWLGNRPSPFAGGC